MTSRAQEILREALTLPSEQRADVAAELLAIPSPIRKRVLVSLDDTDSDTANFEVEWAAEIERRARRVLAGESAGIPWEEVRRRAEAELPKR